MHQFQCDYIAGCHPAVLKALCETNLEEVPGYGEDVFCKEASDMIRAACGGIDADVHFLSGGTQTNLTLIAAALRPHQGVVSASSGHIEAHETGAIESTGHKVMTVPEVDGKVTAEALRRLCADYFENEEKVLLVQPGLLYISFPTETGTIYSLAELEELAAVCREYGLFFYIDGARLVYGLAASPDVTLKDIARLADAFYLGGTKCGTLACEALVIKNPTLKRDFPALMRQRGALLAKGRLGGVQFAALMKNGTVRIRDSAGSPVILDTDIQISSLRVGKRDNRCLDVIDIMPLKFSIQIFPTHISTKLQIQRSNFRSFRQTNNIITI